MLAHLGQAVINAIIHLRGHLPYLTGLIPALREARAAAESIMAARVVQLAIHPRCIKPHASHVTIVIIPVMVVAAAEEIRFFDNMI